MSSNKNSVDFVDNILKKCAQVHLERDKQYGDSFRNFTEIAKIASRIFPDVGDYPAYYNPLDIAIIMVAVKEARYRYAVSHLTGITNGEKVIHDSLIDWITYIAIMENIRLRLQPLDKEVENGHSNT